MAISIGRNQNQIFGKIDGVKFPNLPLDKDKFESLNKMAKEANSHEGDKKKYKELVELFKKEVLIQNNPELKVEQRAVKSTNQKDVKVGSSNFRIAMDQHGNLLADKPFLVNDAGIASRFYIPDNLYKRIQDGESKGLDVTPIFKLFIRALRGEKMTQSKLDNLDKYMSRPWLDKELYNQLVEKGYTSDAAKTAATFIQVPITQEGFIHTYKVSSITQEPNKEAYKEATKKVEEGDYSGFKFKHPRNGSGHFLAKGSEGYITAWNQQRAEYLESTNQTAKKDDIPSISAEDYVFEPYYQHQGGDAFYCGDVLGHDIKVGFVHRLPSWSMVNTDDSQSSVKGLHVGGLEYVYDNQTSLNSPVHNIFVDPQYIGAVCRSENSYGAIRVLQYYVHSSFIAPNKGTYNSSTYGKIVDEEWDKMISEAQDIVAKAKQAQELLDSTFVI